VTYQTMSRAEAHKIVSWVEDNITVSIPDWQREVLATMFMYPDLEFTLPGRYK
jgi:hypothetical protein